MRAKTLAVILAVSVIPTFAQNRLEHRDGTTEFTSRGGAAGTSAVTLYQRYPGDQICGLNTVGQMVLVLQDQNVTTAEPVTFEIRGSDPTYAQGRPDYDPTTSGGPGLIASAGPFTLTFPTPASGLISAAGWTITFNPTVSLLSLTNPLPPGTPNGDVYGGVAVPANAAWPNDGVSEHISTTSGIVNPGEQMNPITNNTYTLIPNQSGMAWQRDTTLNATPLAHVPNRAYMTSFRWVEDVLQPYAENAVAFTGVNSGQNPNYGYAGIFPYLDRQDANLNPIPDNIGFRVRATAPAGYVSLLFASPALLPPFQFPGIGGYLCIDIVTFAPDFPLLLGSATTQAVATNPLSPAGFPGEPTTTTEACFAPLPLGPIGAILQGITFYAQAFTYDPTTGTGNLSCAAAIHF